MENNAINRTTAAATIMFNLTDQTGVSLKDVSWKNGAHVKRGSRKIVETWYAPTKDMYYICVTPEVAEEIAVTRLPIGTVKNSENPKFPVKILVPADHVTKMSFIVARALSKLG